MRRGWEWNGVLVASLWGPAGRLQLNIADRLMHSNGQIHSRARGVELAVTPLALTKAINDPDPAAAKRALDAMLQMKKDRLALVESPRRG
jgi:hypothetical protein